MPRISPATSTTASPGHTPSARVPEPRCSPEALDNPDWTRLVRLATSGDLHALPSPVTGETVLLVYHLPDATLGARGDHADAVFLRQLLHARLVTLDPPAPRFVPNGDVHYLCRITVTAAGQDWLTAHSPLEEPAALRPVDSRPRTFTYPDGWGSASWSGVSRTR